MCANSNVQFKYSMHNYISVMNIFSYDYSGDFFWKQIFFERIFFGRKYSNDENILSYDYDGDFFGRKYFLEANIPMMNIF